MNTAKAKIYYFIRVIGVYRRLKKPCPLRATALRLCQKNRGPSRQGPRIYANRSVDAPHESEIMRHQHQLKVIPSSMQKNIRNASPGCQSFFQRN